MKRAGMATTSKKLSLDEFLRLPEQTPALEYEEGQISRKVSPKPKHSALQAAFVKLLDGFAVPKRLARTFPEVRFTHAGRSRVPDVALYRWEHIARTPEGRIADDFFTPPDITVEIASPGQSISALIRRCQWYVENGTAVALLADPADESLRVFRPGQAPLLLRDDDRIALDDVLPGFDLTVRRLFSALDVD